MLSPDQTYQLLRQLTSPVVAITSERGGKRNGMISDAAIRASIVPSVPRLSVYIHKFNYSHDLIFDTGRFALHLLHTRQFDLVHRLGFVSGRDRDKLADVPHRLGTLGVPVLDECYAHFECRVANVMDTGSSTCFLGDVVAVGFGNADAPQGEVMTAGYFRANVPAEWRQDYERQLHAAQVFAERTSREIRAVTWRGLAPPSPPR
jgi:flavin reductase (DIM6/NTAB) family NADH-FMN oxidoreductase RutF